MYIFFELEGVVLSAAVELELDELVEGVVELEDGVEALASVVVFVEVEALASVVEEVVFVEGLESVVVVVVEAEESVVVVVVEAEESVVVVEGVSSARTKLSENRLCSFLID
jgi:hypothetical protein